MTFPTFCEGCINAAAMEAGVLLLRFILTLIPVLAIGLGFWLAHRGYVRGWCPYHLIAAVALIAYGAATLMGTNP
jgi:hypothetical protein